MNLLRACIFQRGQRLLILWWLWSAFFILAPLAQAQQLHQAAVASADPQATQAGLEILKRGGNAFDAAVAVSAALAVVEPQSSGLGGGGFWLLHRAKDGREILIDGRERAPVAAKAAMYQDEQGNVIAERSLDGPLAAAIPGEPAALVHLAQHYGRRPLKESLAPAIRLANEGFIVREPLIRMSLFRYQTLLASPAARAVFFPSGPLVLGTRLRQPDLAKTLEHISREGFDGFYKGETARLLVDGVQKAGGNWTMTDLASYKIIEREPVVGHYKSYRIISAPPPSAGGIGLIEALNILKGFDLSTMPTELHMHLIIEALRRVYRDRLEYLGDPDFVSIPQARLLSLDYAAGLRASIRLDRAMPSKNLPIWAGGAHEGPDTTHFSIIDQEGNWVSATLSVNYPFGSGFMPPGTGVLLNDEMDDFSAKPGAANVYGLVGSAANAIAPNKRPLSSMTPTFIEGPGRMAVLGTPGGSRIVSMVLLAAIDFMEGADAQAMVSHGRYHHQFLPDEVEYEPGGLNEELLTALAAYGHSLRNTGRRYGDMQVIIKDRKTGALQAASDPRGIGSAVVWQQKIPAR